MLWAYSTLHVSTWLYSPVSRPDCWCPYLCLKRHGMTCKVRVVLVVIRNCHRMSRTRRIDMLLERKIVLKIGDGCNNIHMRQTCVWTRCTCRVAAVRWWWWWLECLEKGARQSEDTWCQRLCGRGAADALVCDWYCFPPLLWFKMGDNAIKYTSSIAVNYI